MLMAYLVHYVTELHEGHANQPILTSKAVVFDADVKFEADEGLFIPNSTTKYRIKNWIEMLWWSIMVISREVSSTQFKILDSLSVTP